MRRNPVPLTALAVVLLALASGSSARGESVEQSRAGWLGVMLGGAAAAADAEVDPGVRISGVIEDGPAERAGLRARDRIVTIDGATLESSSDLVARIKGLAPGSWVTIEIERRGERREIRLRLGERPRGAGEIRVRRGWIGVRAIDLPAPLREHFGAPDDAGVMISEVEPGSPAEAAGFLLADVVYDVDGRPVRKASELRGIVGGGGVGNVLEFTLVRDGAEIVLEATVDVEPERAVVRTEEDPPGS